MSTRVIERVDEWSDRRFAGGYGALRDLAAEEFSGVVRAGGAELYMTKGAVVGIRNGGIGDFEDAEGTVHEAPTPALPLLAIMQERSDGARAQYYTEDTAVDEVDAKLEAGGFTGFIELSENVLSGDYYAVYHGGRSMSVAFVGNSKNLIEGDEAFERANGEVGIYKVYPVEVEPIEIPEPSGATTGESADTGPAIADSGPDPDTAGGDDDGAATDAAREADGETATDAPDHPTPGADETGGGPAEGTAAETEPGAGGDGEDESAAEAKPEEGNHGQTEGESTDGQESPDEPAEGETEEQETEGRADRDRGQTGATQKAESQAGAGALETRAIPSLDPERSQTAGEGEGHREASDTHGETADDPTGTERPTGAPAESPGQSADREATDGEAGVADTGRIEELRATLDDREAEIERLESELGSAADERDRLRDEVAALREERNELESEVERLEGKLERLEGDAGSVAERGRRITPEEALGGTDLFVRYHSKGEATLEDAHDGGARREDVIGNLRLEKHTQFDTDSVAVEGQAYAEFLEETVAYQFVEWLTTELLFEIRDTGHTGALGPLFDALPKIDRAELNGSVEIVEPGGEGTPESFDVVLRDRMGGPLLVANINSSREAATESMMGELVTASERVGRASEAFAAAFFVTESFFEPGALETASEATRGGLLSRNKQKSFVNLSRKHGYHLCLVEARGDHFNLTVPEL